jgi:hypothetical protein
MVALRPDRKRLRGKLDLLPPHGPVISAGEPSKRLPGCLLLIEFFQCIKRRSAAFPHHITRRSAKRLKWIEIERRRRKRRVLQFSSNPRFPGSVSRILYAVRACSCEARLVGPHAGAEEGKASMPSFRKPSIGPGNAGATRQQ